MCMPEDVGDSCILYNFFLNIIDVKVFEEEFGKSQQDCVVGE